MMAHRQLRKDFKLCLMKYFLICSLILLTIQDALSAADMRCEIKSSCSSSAGCQYTKPMTVDPGSKITLNCSVTGGLALDMTWKQAKQRLEKGNGSSDLILHNSSSTNIGKYSCLCTEIHFTRALQISWGSSTPNDIIEGLTTDLECEFSGWPLPLVVYWYKDEKLIINGTNGIYQSEEKKGKYLHSTLHLPPGREEQEGFYKCNATNSITGWSSSTSYEIETAFECSLPQSPTISSPEILASMFSNISLTCRIDDDGTCPQYLLWFLDNKTAPLEDGEKYKMEERETHTQCKIDFILTIFNVTENDEGRYSCHWVCEYEETKKAAIDLKVFVELSPTDILPESNTVLAPSPHIGSRQKWLLPIIILSAVSVAVIFMSLVRFCVKKKWTSSYKIQKREGLKEGDYINRLFISFSSKDSGWVTENLISVLEKHSIAYSIHTRDFELGRPIVQNMADNVYGSRQVLIVLSQNYLASNFCREELHMAIQRGVDSGDSSLILVAINNLKKRQLPAAVRNKQMLDFDKHKKKQDWEEKILREILEGKTTSV